MYASVYFKKYATDMSHYYNCSFLFAGLIFLDQRTFLFIEYAT